MKVSLEFGKPKCYNWLVMFSKFSTAVNGRKKDC